MKKKKKDSNVAFEVKLSYTACMCWAQTWQEQKLKPTDIEASLPRKIQRLEAAIKRETILFETKSSQALDLMLKKIVLLPPKDIYNEGVKLFKEGKYVESKEVFIQYRNRVEKKQPNLLNPSDDEHLKFLTDIQDILNQSLTNSSGSSSVMSVSPNSNRYRVQWEEWQKTYPRRSSSSSSSSSSSFVPTFSSSNSFTSFSTPSKQSGN